MPYISETDNVIIKIQLEKLKSDSKLIKGIIDKWERSEARAEIISGRKYYEGKHDILEKDFQNVNIWNKERESFDIIKNPNAPSIAIENCFLTELVDHKRDYIVGNRIKFQVKDSNKDEAAKKREDDLNNELKDYFEVFTQQWVTSASSKGYEPALIFVNSKGGFDYLITPAENVIPDIDESTGELLSVMRYYKVDKQNEKGEVTQITRVEIWDSEKTYFFIQPDENGEFKPDGEKYHFELEWKATSESEPDTYGLSWGRVPFIFLNNNSEKISDLKRIKNSIDAYDSVKTGFFHDVDAIQQVIYHVNDYEGTDKTELPSLIKLFKVVSTSGEQGKFEAIQIDIPFEAKKTILELIEKDIYKFGQGVNMGQLASATDPRIVAIKAQFYPLDLKANKMILQLRLAAKEFLWFLLYFMEKDKNPRAQVNEKEIDKKLNDIDVIITKSIITNEAELIKLLNDDTIMSKKAKMEMHPFIKDPAQNAAELEEEMQASLDNVEADPVDQNNEGNQE